MTNRDVIESFWTAMEANDWKAAAAHLGPDCPIDWPCSGERFVGRDTFAALQAGYPTETHRWHFDIHRIVVEEDTAVSEVTVDDGKQSARVVAFSEIRDGSIVRQVEYWPVSYDPPLHRGVPVERIDPVP